VYIYIYIYKHIYTHINTTKLSVSYGHGCSVGYTCYESVGLSHWPRGLWSEYAASCLLGVTCSNPAGGKNVCLLWLSCVFR